MSDSPFQAFSHGSGGSRPDRILLVEDNPEDARLFEELMRESGRAGDVQWEDTLDSALSAVDKRRPDVVVVDLGLSDSEGVRTVERIVEVAPDLPIVVLTGHQSDALARSVLEVGATESLRKDELTPRLLARTLRWSVERKSMERTLKEREQQLRSITEHISEGIYRSAPDEGLVYVNQAFADLFGYESPEEITSVDPVELYVRPERRRELRGLLRREGSFQNEEVECRRKDGSTFTVLQSGSVVRDGTGEIVFFDGVVTDITKWRATQKKLEKSEKRVRSVLDALAANVVVLDRDGTIVDVNQKWEQFSREHHGDLDPVEIGDNYLTACGPAEEGGSAAIPAVREEVRAVAEGERGLFEYQYSCHNGPDEERWMSLRATPLEGAEGGAVVAHIDVTTRVQAVRKQRVLSSAVDQAQEAVLITRADAIDEPGPEIVYVNSAVEDMTGYAKDELIGQTPRILQGPDTERDVLDSLREALEAGEEFSDETINYRKDGTPYRVRWSIAPVWGEEGDVEYWVSVQRDVTEEREREQQMAQMAQALDQVGDKVFITDRNGQIQYVNEAFEEITGYREEEVVGKTPAVLQSGEQDEAFYEELWEALLSGESFRAEFINEKKDGIQYVEDELISPLTDEEGEVTHFVSAGRDVTERKEREEALRRHRNLLQQTQRLAGAWEVSLSSGEVTWSEEAYRICEVPVGKDMGLEESFEFFVPEGRERLREAFEQCIEEGEPYDLELPLITAEDNRRWVRAVGAPVEEDGAVVKVAGAIQDITDRKEAEQALRESEELHRATLSNITDTVLLTDADGAFTYVCPNVEYIFDQSEEEVEALGSISALLGNDPAEEHDFEGAQEISNVEHSVLDASGERHDLLVNVRRVSIQDGRRMYTCRDITGRKRAEEALRRREEYLSVTLRSIGDAVVATNREGCITEMNAVAERLTGWSREDAEGKPLDDVLALHSARTGEEVESPVEEVLQAGETVGLANHTVLTSRDGTEYQIEDSAAPIRSEDGELLGVVLVFRDITEEYDRRRQIERQNDLFEKAQDLANVGGWEYDVRADEHIWTDQVYDIYGLPDSFDPTVQEGIAHYHPDDRPIIRKVFTRAVEEGEAYDEELRLVSSDGEQRWVRTRGEPQIEDGDVVRVRGTIQDITDRKEYEVEIERMTNLLRLAEEMTDVGGWSVDMRGERPYQAEWTDHLNDIFGLPSQEKPSIEEVFEYYHPEDRERHRQAVYRAQQTGKGWDQELRLVRADGTERWVHNIGVPIIREGEVVELQGAIQDITDRKEREQELKVAKEEAEAAQELFETILNNVPVMIDFFDADGNLQMVNEHWESVLGWSEAEIREYSDPTEVLYPSAEMHQEAREFMEVAPDEWRDFQFQTKNGEVLDTTWTNVELSDGRRIGIGLDITDRKERERKLREAKEEAEQMNRLKSAFLANMSHEIRTPLTSIIGFAEIIGDEVEALEPQDTAFDISILSRYSNLIRKGGQRLMETLEDVLDLSKLEAGEMNLSEEVVDLREEARGIVEQFEPQVQEAQIDLQADFPEEGVWAHVDPEGLRIALRNLVNNATKYTEKGGQVWVRVRREEGVSVIEVEDTGIGMDPERVPELFEAFMQESEGIGREYEGSGLGLTVTKKIVDQMDGSIDVETEKGEGSCFSIRLPRAEG